MPPSRPSLAKVSDESIMVMWEGSEDGGLPIMFYKVGSGALLHHLG